MAGQLSAAELQRQIELMRAQNAAFSALAGAGMQVPAAPPAMAHPFAGAAAAAAAAASVTLPASANPDPGVNAAWEAIAAASAPPPLESIKERREKEKRDREEKRKQRKLKADESDDRPSPLPAKPPKEGHSPHADDELKHLDAVLASGKVVDWFREAHPDRASADADSELVEVAMQALLESRDAVVSKLKASDPKFEAPPLPASGSQAEEPKKKSFFLLKRNTIGAPKRKAAVRSAVRPAPKPEPEAPPLPLPGSSAAPPASAGKALPGLLTTANRSLASLHLRDPCTLLAPSLTCFPHLPLRLNVRFLLTDARTQ